jgi:Domain of unknown function (DUF3859)
MRRLPSRPFLARFIVLALTGLFTGARLHANPPSVDHAEIVNFGIYTQTVMSENSAPDTPSGKSNVVGNVRLAAQTHTVPLQTGVAFGYWFKLVGSPVNAQVALRYVLIYPPGGVTNTVTGKHYESASDEYKGRIGSEMLIDYSLDNSWELVPGAWTLQVWLGDRKLAEEVFTVARQ